MTVLRRVVIAFACTVAWSAPLRGQTLLPTQAVHEVNCQSFLGIFNKCVTMQTDRLHSAFTVEKLGYRLYGRGWATASHCTRLDPSMAKCKQSVFISTDPEWNRIVWGQSDTFLRHYGTGGTPADGVGRFLGPRGADITRREGEWHVGFIADTDNDRIVVLAVGYTCKCVQWLGTLDGSESGTPLRNPYDVGWDALDTWSLADDRVFIADTDNNRVVVYQVNLNPAAGTMTKTYLGAFGSYGQGPANFARPEGINVRSWTSVYQMPWGPVTILTTQIYVSDTDNGRVSLWYYDTQQSGTPAAQSAPVAGSEFVGIARDHYGDVIVADRARDVLVKYVGYGAQTLTLLKTYGGTPSWSTGNFNDPTDVTAIPHYWQDTSGNLVPERLPFLQTVEQWTSSTGGQLHHIGVDADGLGVTPGSCEATFTFLLTAYGDYAVKVKNAGGTVVASWSRTAVTSGTKSEYWNASGNPAGTYSYAVEHRNAYGDETVWRTSTGPTFNPNCPFVVTANAPGLVTVKQTYQLTGSADAPAGGWLWEQSYNGAAYGFWSNQQNSAFVAYNGTYTLDWRLSAARNADGVRDTAWATTRVCIPYQPATCGYAARTVDDEATRPNSSPRGRGSKATGDHFGSGVWIALQGGERPQLIRMFSFSGQHDASTVAAPWPNIIERDGGAWTYTVSPGVLSVATRRQPAGEGRSLLLVTGRLTVPGARRTLALGLAADPDLGDAEDDVLGFDPDLGLVWVRDSSSGRHLGYMALSTSGSARARQFGAGPDDAPESASAALEVLKAPTRVTAGQRGDVRFLLTGPNVAVRGDGGFEATFALLHATSEAALLDLARATRRDAATLLAGTAVNQSVDAFALRQSLANPSPAMSATGAGSAQAAVAQLQADGLTALDYSVPTGQEVTVRIRVYNSRGQLVRTLVDESVSGGTYHVEWDRLNERGQRAAPGVYVAVMEAGGFRATRKLVVTR